MFSLLPLGRLSQEMTLSTFTAPYASSPRVGAILHKNTSTGEKTSKKSHSSLSKSTKIEPGPPPLDALLAFERQRVKRDSALNWVMHIYGVIQKSFFISSPVPKVNESVQTRGPLPFTFCLVVRF